MLSGGSSALDSTGKQNQEKLTKIFTEYVTHSILTLTQIYLQNGQSNGYTMVLT
jgi:hypothetical protein